MRPKNKSAKRSEETKKKGKRLGKEQLESHEQTSLVRGESERHASPINGRVEREMKRSKSNLEQTCQQRPAQCAAEQQPLPASLTGRPATVTRTQSVYKVKQGGESGRPSTDRTTAAVKRPPLVSAPSSVIRSAAASVASTFPRSGPAQPAGDGGAAATAASSTFPRRRPSEFDSGQVRGTQMLGREAWPEESSGFIQVADLEVMEEAEKKVKEEIVKESNMEEKEEQKEEEVEDIYQIPKPPVPVVVGKKKVQVIPYQKFFC
jgi:hypothetical protein